MTAVDVLEGRAQRFESCRFDLWDRLDARKLGELMLDQDRPPTIENDTTQSLRRRLRGLHVLTRPLYDVDPQHVYRAEYDVLTCEVHAWWLIDTPSDGLQEWPIGVFLFADDSTTKLTAGDEGQAEMVDRCQLLDQSIDRSLGWAAGTSIAWAMHVVAELAGVPLEVRSIEATALTFGAPVAYAPGRDTYLAVLESLASAAGFLPPYFDNSGILVLRSAPDLEHTEPDFRYGLDTVVIDGSVVESTDQLAAPNRYVAIGGNLDQPVVGIFDVPDSAPYSFARTGIRRRRTVDVQGVADDFTAVLCAAGTWIADRTSFSWLSFDTPVDPRHDTFDVIDFDGDRFLQLGWTMACRAGATQQHNGRGTYS